MWKKIENSTFKSKSIFMDHTDFELVAFRHEPELHRALWAAAASVEDCRQTFPVQVNPVVKIFPPNQQFSTHKRPLFMIMVEKIVKKNVPAAVLR